MSAHALPGPPVRSTPLETAAVPHRADPLDPRSAVLELGDLVLGEQPLGEVLRRVADLAAALTGVDDVAVVVVEGRTVRSAAFTTPVAAALDERLPASGPGPGLGTARTGRTTHLPDLDDAPGQPGFTALARRHGVRSVASVALSAARRPVGSLTFYGTGSSPVDHDAVALGETFGRHAAVVLLNAVLHASLAERVEQIQAAMAARATIEQAKGVLMARLRCSPDDAFDVLSSTSQDTRAKLRDVAADVVAGAREGAPGSAEDGSPTSDPRPLP